ncbi:flagellar biosynthesis protein FlhB [Thiomonas sp. FB-Cd]|uniref:flagellar biosynthesis protein FlhB n=1 Tax=Thiomonas sp. FB-Cd TaxID=1158292 RepID=UPI0004DF2859|nr:flagellar biosynthesis protein FlhB [Thiomonas sp. FB-Cd]
MADEGAQDKELPASQKRKQQAREKGQVARSRDLTSTLLLLGVGAIVFYGGGWVFQQGGAMLRSGLSIPSAAARDPLQMLRLASHVGLYGVFVLVPILLLTVATSLAGGLAIGGWVFSIQALTPDWTRLDPITGVQRMFSRTGLGELGKAVLKALVIGVIASLVLWNDRGSLLQLLQVEPARAPMQLAMLCGQAFFWLAASTVLVAAVDVPWQIFQLNSKLKMSRQDVQDEMRESEGNPQMKQRIRSMQRERARKRMMEAVPKADVVVTNPQHFAVALAYEQGLQRAPVVLAMGVGHVALRIRELAAQAHVPVVEAPPLARALYRYGELEREIPAALYSAVALLLAYVYQLRVMPQNAALPDDWTIPAEIDTSSEAMPVH